MLTDSSYVDKLHDYTRAYPKCGYGLRFFDWVYEGRRGPYNSWGNSSAMRVNPVAFAFDRLEDVVQREGDRRGYRQPSRRHTGAEATAAATFVARQGASKNEIREIVEKQFGYDLSLR